ncbi:Methyltransferase type 11 protein [Rutstroemia sp. NJR-2017a WRK4]|nr:Methyltransferase type 11 protein [Rutstroemia sp. NJR-2017a WRK4]
MSTTALHSKAGLETFDDMNIAYERAYSNNPFKKFCISRAISLLPPRSRVLDIGCGTGIPVSEMLSLAGLDVVGFDISPKMVVLAKSRVQGTFSVSDMVDFKVQGTFAGAFMIFSHLQMSYAAVHEAVYKFASALEPGGIFVLGQTPADTYVGEEEVYDETGTYVEDFNIPFMGEALPTFAMSEEGQRKFLSSMGLEIVSETVDVFQPDNPKCEPEVQQYIIARRPIEGSISKPQPMPREI